MSKRRGEEEVKLFLCIVFNSLLDFFSRVSLFYFCYLVRLEGLLILFRRRGSCGLVGGLRLRCDVFGFGFRILFFVDEWA